MIALPNEYRRQKAIEIHAKGWQANQERSMREEYAAYLKDVTHANQAMSYEEFKRKVLASQPGGTR